MMGGSEEQVAKRISIAVAGRGARRIWIIEVLSKMVALVDRFEAEDVREFGVAELELN